MIRAAKDGCASEITFKGKKYIMIGKVQVFQNLTWEKN